MAYHHGDLRTAILQAAAAVIAAEGVTALSLRALARDVGVTHTAPRHHFGDKRGVLTALAAQGYEGLAAAVRAEEGDFLAAGVAYVRYALTHPAHYQVMFHPELVDTADEAYAAALRELGAALLEGLAARQTGRGRTAELDDPPVAQPDGIPPAALAAWSIAHGFTTLALTHNLPVAEQQERVPALTDLARQTLRHLTY